ncbi:MAG: glucose-6-phosphate isomerase, partial [Bradymonadia bacterium]
METNKADVLARMLKHAMRLKSDSLKSLVAQSQRSEALRIETHGLYFDFSKHMIDQEALGALSAYATSCSIDTHIRAYFSGEKINVTEDRAVLHTALRRGASDTLIVDGQDVVKQVHAVLDRLTHFCDGVHNGKILGSSGQSFTDVVNIGIGGSDLGPAMAYRALWAYHHPQLRVHYVSNIDGTALAQTLSGLNAHTTLFIVASKTFTTQETLTNARTARGWLIEKLGQESAVKDHFVAVSTNEAAVVDFGIAPERMFEFWDWVGGRFSIWSSIGLSLMLGIGSKNFRLFLEGGRQMDRHFEETPIEQNAPMLMALLGFWYGQYFGSTAHAVLPYDEGLGRLPAFLQQGEMESNGKSTDREGHTVQGMTCPVVFGEAGTNGQHAFYQLLHQGTHLIPADFILPLKPHHHLPAHHEILASHCFAQTEALMNGRSIEDVRSSLTAA